MASSSDSIRIGDLVFCKTTKVANAASTQTTEFLMLGDSAANRVSGLSEGTSSYEAQMLEGVFRIQSVHDYAAARERQRYMAQSRQAVAGDDAILKQLKQREQAELERNIEEDRKTIGQAMHYGQLVQLVHYSSSSLVEATNSAKAELDVSALKISLTREGSSNCYFKIMPRFKVRSEGQKVRRGDQVVLLHLKTSLAVTLSSLVFPDRTDVYEVHLSTSETGWTLETYAPFEGGVEKYLQSSDYVRLFHANSDGFLKGDVSFAQENVFLFKRSQNLSKRKNTVLKSDSSNTIFMVELRDVGQGGVIGKRDLRLKHTGSQRYLSCVKVGDKIAENGTLEYKFELVRDIDNDSTVFSLSPLDQVQHIKTKGWITDLPRFDSDLSISKSGKQEKGGDSKKASANTRIQHLSLCSVVRFQDTFVAAKVSQEEVENLQKVVSVRTSLKTFVQKLRGKEKRADGPILRDTNEVSRALCKCISLVSLFNTDEAPEDEQKRFIWFIDIDGEPIRVFQELVREQQIIETIVDILSHLCLDLMKYDKRESPWQTNASEVQPEFLRNIKDPKFVQQRVVSRLCYKLLQLIGQDNEANGNVLSRYMDLWYGQLPAEVGAASCFKGMYENNVKLLSKLTAPEMEKFVALVPPNYKTFRLKFITALIGLDGTPLPANQTYMFSSLQTFPLILRQFRLSDDKTTIEFEQTSQKWIRWDQLTTSSREEDVWWKEHLDLVNTLQLNIDQTKSLQARMKFKKETITTEGTRYVWTRPDNLTVDETELTRYIEGEIHLLRRLIQGGRTDILKGLSGSVTWQNSFLDPDLILFAITNAKVPGASRGNVLGYFATWFTTQFKLLFHAQSSDKIKTIWTLPEFQNSKFNTPLVQSKDSERHKHAWMTEKNIDRIVQLTISELRDNLRIELADEDNLLYLFAWLKFVSEMISLRMFTLSSDGNSQTSQLVSLLLQMVDGRTDKHLFTSNEDLRLKLTNSTNTYFKVKRLALQILDFFVSRHIENTIHAFLHISNSKQPSSYERGDQVLTKSENYSGKTLFEKPEEAALVFLDCLLYDDLRIRQLALSMLYKTLNFNSEVSEVLGGVQIVNGELTETFNQIREIMPNIMEFLMFPTNSEMRAEAVVCLKKLINRIGSGTATSKPVQKLMYDMNVLDGIFGLLALVPTKNDSFDDILQLCIIFLKNFCFGFTKNKHAVIQHSIELMANFKTHPEFPISAADVLLECVKSPSVASKVPTSLIQSICEVLEDLATKQIWSQKLVDVLSCLIQREVEPNARLANQRAILVQLVDRPSIFVKFSDFQNRRRKAFSNNSGKSEIDRRSQGAPSIEDQLEEARKSNVPEDSLLLYHARFIYMLGLATSGSSGSAEATCQQIVPLDICFNVLLADINTIDPLLKSAYAFFMSDAWFLTAKLTKFPDESLVSKLVEITLRELLLNQSLETNLQRIFPNDNSAAELADSQFRMLYGIFHTKAVPRDFKLKSEDLLNLITDFSKIWEKRLDGRKLLYDLVESIFFCFPENAAGFQTIHKELLRSLPTRQATTKKLDKAQSDSPTAKYMADSVQRGKLAADEIGKVELKQLVDFFSNTRFRQFQRDGSVIKSLPDYVSQIISVLNPESNPDGKIVIPKQLNRKITNLFGASTKLIEIGKSDLLRAGLVILYQSLESEEVLNDVLVLLTRLFESNQGSATQKMFVELTKTQARLTSGTLSFLRESLMTCSDAFKRARSAKKHPHAKSNMSNEESDNSLLEAQVRATNVLRFIQALCAGHFIPIKNLLRSQDSARNYNIVEIVAEFANSLEKSMILKHTDHQALNMDTVHLAAKLFSTLTSLCSGCPENLTTLVNSKTIAVVNRLIEHTIPSHSKNLPALSGVFQTKTGLTWGSNQLVLSKGKLVEISGTNQEHQKQLQFNEDGVTGDRMSLKSMNINENVSVSFENREGTAPFIMVVSSPALTIRIKHENLKLLEEWLDTLVRCGAETTEKLEANVRLNIKAMNNAMKDPKVVHSTLGLHKHICQLLLCFTESQLPENASSTLPIVLLETLSFQSIDGLMKLSWSLNSHEDPNVSHLSTHVFSYAAMLVRSLRDFEDKKPRSKEQGEGPVRTLVDSPIWSEWLEENVRSVEVLNSERIDRVWFPLPTVAENLDDAAKEKLMTSLNRESPTSKVEDFLGKSELLNYQLYYKTFVAKLPLSWIFLEDWIWRRLSNLFAIIINLLMLIFWIDDGTGLDEEDMISDEVRLAMRVFAGLHIFCSLLMVICYAVNWCPIILYEKESLFKMRRQRRNIKQAAWERSKIAMFFVRTWWVFTDVWLLYHLLYLALSATGFKYLAVFCFHMIDLPIRNPGVQNVLRAVTYNGVALLLTAGLGLTIIYLFSVLSFFFLNDLYDPSSAIYCDTLFHCFLTNYLWGLRSGGGIADQLGVIGADGNYGRWWVYFFYSSAFHELIIIVLLQMIFGIILNTFGQLRDERDAMEEDIENVCSICSRPSDDFERYSSSGFSDHLDKEHHIWNYLYLFTYLRSKEHEADFSYTEKYIWDSVQKGSTEFFPINRAIVLENDPKEKKEN